MAKKQETKKSGILYKDLIRFRNGFEAVAGMDAPAAFSVKIIRNLRIVQESLDDLDKLIEPSKDYIEKYQPEVEKLAKKFCKKDPNGLPLPRKTANNQTMYDFDPGEKEKFDKEVEKLEKKPEFKPLTEARKKQFEKYTEALEEECDVTFVKIPEKELPNNIQPRIVDLFFELIEF